MTSAAISSDTVDTLLNVNRYRASERVVRAEKDKSKAHRALCIIQRLIVNRNLSKQMDYFVRNDTFTIADVAPVEVGKRTDSNAIDRIWG
jgi:hypothetical protein